mgnify:CR=1 FL=1
MRKVEQSKRVRLEIHKCPGCGAQIQFEQPGKPGFIPSDVYEKRLKEGKELLCQRCFKIKNYGMLISDADEEEIMDFLMKVIKNFKHILYVFDVFDFEGTYRPEIIELLSETNILYVANKFDTLPSIISASQLKEWLRNRIDAPNSKIFVTSTKNGFGIKKLKKELEKLSGDLLVLGVTNVGKSSILKALTDSDVTVSPYPGTTLGLVEHKLNKLRIFDAPGIITNDRMIELFDSDCQSKVFAKGEVSRKTFKPYPEDVIFVSGLCQIKAKLLDNFSSVNSELRPIFQIYAPENVTFHKTKNEEFLESYPKHFGKLLVPPCKKFDLSLLNLKEERVIVSSNEELSIAGLCWINVKRGPVEFTLRLPENVKVHLRESLMKPKRKFNENSDD